MSLHQIGGAHYVAGAISRGNCAHCATGFTGGSQNGSGDEALPARAEGLGVKPRHLASDKVR